MTGPGLAIVAIWAVLAVAAAVACRREVLRSRARRSRLDRAIRRWDTAHGAAFRRVLAAEAGRLYARHRLLHGPAPGCPIPPPRRRRWPRPRR